MSMFFSCQHAYGSNFHMDVTFEAEKGVTAICGPSGSGKTTIVMLIAGLLRAKEGRIVLDGDVLVDTGERVWVPPQRRGIGVVFQDNLLFPHLTVKENLRYGHKRRPSSDASFDEVVEVLELGDLLHRRPATLSGGQARRVALGRSLLCGPRMLLLDEPITGLDGELKTRILAFLQEVLRHWHIPTILVSHDEESVTRLAHAVIQVVDGRVSETRTRPASCLCP